MVNEGKLVYKVGYMLSNILYFIYMEVLIDMLLLETEYFLSSIDIRGIYIILVLNDI